ncbi:MAG TPA: alanyl-tRNA editing protein [Thermoplasmata archaeon]|nr:alanyl-tRNA editing protein [Thermoplasmata archaeon]
MATKKLFREEPYKRRCEAVVTSLKGKEITLDQTIFFAFAGGQASDRGTIGGIPVKESKVVGDEIVYQLETEPPFKEGDKVTICLDYKRREKLMRLHSATHLVYFIFNEMVGNPELIGSNVSEEKGRLDYHYPENIAPLLIEIEKKVNTIIEQDWVIKTYPDEKKRDKWWWVCGKWKCPCGGTHVSSTKEIGEVRLKRRNIGAGKERIEIYVKS